MQVCAMSPLTMRFILLAFVLLHLQSSILCETTLLPEEYYFSMEETTKAVEEVKNTPIIRIQAVNMSGNIDLSSLKVLTKSPNKFGHEHEEIEANSIQTITEFLTKAPTDAVEHLMNVVNGTSGTLPTTTEKLIIVTPLKTLIDEGLQTTTEKIDIITGSHDFINPTEKDGYTTEVTQTITPDERETTTQQPSLKETDIATNSSNIKEQSPFEAAASMESKKEEQDPDETSTAGSEMYIVTSKVPTNISFESIKSEEVENLSSFMEVDEQILRENTQKSDDTTSIEDVSRIMNEKDSDSSENRSIFENEEQTLEKLGENEHFPRVPETINFPMKTEEKSAEMTTSLSSEITGTPADVETIFSNSVTENIFTSPPVKSTTFKEEDVTTTESGPEDMENIFPTEKFTSVEDITNLFTGANFMTSTEVISPKIFMPTSRNEEIASTTVKEIQTSMGDNFLPSTEVISPKMFTTTSRNEETTTLFTQNEEIASTTIREIQTSTESKVSAEVILPKVFTSTARNEESTTLLMLDEEITTMKDSQSSTKNDFFQYSTTEFMTEKTSLASTKIIIPKIFATTSRNEESTTLFIGSNEEVTPTVTNDIQSSTKNEVFQYSTMKVNEMITQTSNFLNREETTLVPMSSTKDIDILDKAQEVLTKTTSLIEDTTTEVIIPVTISIPVEMSTNFATVKNYDSSTEPLNSETTTLFKITTPDDKKLATTTDIFTSTTSQDVSKSFKPELSIPQEITTTLIADIPLTTEFPRITEEEVTANDIVDIVTILSTIPTIFDTTVQQKSEDNVSEEMKIDSTTSFQPNIEFTSSKVAEEIATDPKKEASSMEVVTVPLKVSSTPENDNVNAFNSFDYVVEDGNQIMQMPQDDTKQDRKMEETSKVELFTEKNVYKTEREMKQLNVEDTTTIESSTSEDSETSSPESIENLQSDDPVSTTVSNVNSEANTEVKEMEIEEATDPEITGKIKGAEVRFSVKINGEDSNFFIPPDAFLTFRRPNLVNITWKSSNPSLNNSLGLNLDKFQDSMELHIVKGGRMSVHRSVPENKLETGSVALDDGIRVHFSNVDFLNPDQMKADSLPSPSTSQQTKALAAEIMGGCIGFAVVLGIIVYFTVQRYRGRTRSFKPNLPA